MFIKFIKSQTRRPLKTLQTLQLYKLQFGFTLIETLVAIAILILAIVGPLTIASNSLNSAYYANDQVTAFYLAQEGIEYLRYLRDANFINQLSSNGATWDTGMTGCTSSSLCGLDSSNVFTGGKILVTCGNNIASCPVQYDSSTGLYHQGSAYGTSPFYRTIQVQQINSNEDKVTVTVYWSVGNLKAPASFQITENLFNWDNLYSGASGGTPMANVTINITTVSNGTVISNPTGINCPSTCSTSVVTNNNIVLTGTPNSSYVFTWGAGQACSGHSSCSFNPNSNITLNAGFYTGSGTLSVSGGRALQVSADGVTKCSGGNSCSTSIVNGSVTSVTTSAGYTTGSGEFITNWSFDHWNGGPCNSNSNNVCNFIMNGNTNMTAVYVAD
ncbi:MAG TPA: type II secretion system protein [Candidatus Paceibacterota bacterium]|nr:type II secretion system protein [Candidatus Paceibacterota bacterium]